MRFSNDHKLSKTPIIEWWERDLCRTQNKTRETNWLSIVRFTSVTFSTRIIQNIRKWSIKGWRDRIEGRLVIRLGQIPFRFVLSFIGPLKNKRKSKRTQPSLNKRQKRYKKIDEYLCTYTRQQTGHVMGNETAAGRDTNLRKYNTRARAYDNTNA